MKQLLLCEYLTPDTYFNQDVYWIPGHHFLERIFINLGPVVMLHKMAQ